MSVREASRNFGINEATLRDKLKHVNSLRGWHGVAMAIPKEESEFAHLLTLKSKWGFASTREEVKCLDSLVQKYVQANKNLDTPVSKHFTFVVANSETSQ